MRSDIVDSLSLGFSNGLKMIQSPFAANVKNPPGHWLGGFCATRRYLLRFAHPRTRAGIQQQQCVVVELGIIVIANLLYRR